MRLVLTLLVLAYAPCASGQLSRQSTPPRRSTTPLIGEWHLNPGRSHFAPGVHRRRRELFACAAEAQGVQCTIRSVRSDSQQVIGRFTATLDGREAPVTGMPDVDGVRLRQVDGAIVDATFSFGGVPAFGYRAIRSDDGRSLMIVSVEPISRKALGTVVVYDRR